MSRKCNTKHPDRGASNYPQRLAARGLTKTPTMASVESLRKRQASPAWLAAHPTIAAHLAVIRAGGEPTCCRPAK